MPSSRVLPITGFALLLGLGFLQTRGDAQANSVKKIVDGVWFREGDMKAGHCNNAIIEMKDYLIVVDANFPGGARLALEDAKRLSKKPVKYVFDTHHHGDHAYGNAVWTRQGSITLAYSAVAEEMKRYEPARWKETEKHRPDVAEMHLDAPEPPKQTFSKSPFVLDDGQRKAEFHFFGWAHTRGDGMVYLPKDKVLCSGDAAVNGAYNNTADANIGNWPKVMENAGKLDVKYVLPGHGPSGGPEILTGQREFMLALAKAVKSAAKLEDLGKVEAGKLVSTTVKLPPTVKNWVGEPLAAQVQDAFNENTQGQPAGALPHK